MILSTCTKIGVDIVYIYINNIEYVCILVQILYFTHMHAEERASRTDHLLMNSGLLWQSCASLAMATLHVKVKTDFLVGLTLLTQSSKKTVLSLKT